MTSHSATPVGMVVVAARPIESALRRMQPYALLIGGALIVLTMVFNVPDNGILQLRDQRSLGRIAAHSGVLLVALGLLPWLPQGLGYLAALPQRRRVAALASSIIATGLVMVAASFMSPRFMREILTREWGLVEPAQFVLYLLAARLCFSHAAGLHATATRLSQLYRAGGWLAVVFALEEIDYLGIAAVVIRLGGNPDGRLAGRYVGSPHDLLNLLPYHPSIVVPVLVVALGVIVWLGYRARGYLHLGWRELASATSWPLLGTVAFMTVAQVADTEKSLLGSIATAGLEVRNLLEEPLELLAIMCLETTLLLKLTAVMSERAIVEQDGLEPGHHARRA